MAKEFVDRETGEIIKVASYRTEAQQKAYQDKQKRDAINTKANNPFIFSEMDTLQGGLSLLSNKELGYFLLLQTYVDYKNMVKANVEAKIPMNTQDIADALSVSKKTVGVFLRKFEKMDLITRERVEIAGKKYRAVFINSNYCFKKGIGTKLSSKKTDRAVKVFINTLQESFKQGLQPADIGFIYKTIQFIHYDTNLLVLDPYEKELEAVETLSLDALAKAVGMSIEETSKRLVNLRWNGMYVYGKIRVGRELMIKANPYLLYRKAGDFEGTLGAEFIVNGRKNNLKY